MSAIDNTPTNKNLLNPLNFLFQIKKAPHLNFFVQKVNIPSIQLPSIDIPTVFNYIPNPGNKLQYGELIVTFKVDEDFGNYLELHDWIRKMGFPESFEEYKSIKDLPQYTGEGIFSDISLIALNAVKKPNFEVVYKDAFPVYLSEVNFDTTYDDVQYVTATAQFRFTLFDITKI